MHLNSANLPVFPYSSLTPAPKEKILKGKQEQKTSIFSASPSPSFVLVVLAAVCHIG